MRGWSLAVIVAVCWGAAPRAQQPASGGTQAAAAAFGQALIRAMVGHDRDAVASMIKYPATAIVGGFNVPLGNRATTREVYPVVFTPELGCELERHAATVDAAGGTLAAGRL